MVFCLIPNIYSLLVYIAHTRNGMCMRKKPPYKYPIAWSHFDLFSSSPYLLVVIILIFVGVFSYCKWNPGAAEAMYRWNGGDPPWCQHAEMWELASAQYLRGGHRQRGNGWDGRRLPHSPFGHQLAVTVAHHLVRALCGPRRWTSRILYWMIPTQLRNLLLSKLSLWRKGPMDSWMTRSLQRCLEPIDVPYVASIHYRRTT